MENNNLSNIWKSQAEQEIKQYSISELDRMIVKNTRHSIIRLFPGLKIKVFLSVLVSAYLLWLVIAGQLNLSLKIFYCLLIALIVVSWALVWISLRKLQKPNPAIPVRDWLKGRIAEIDQSIAYQKKYGIGISIGVVLFVAGICITQNYILNGMITLIAFGSALLAVSITLYLSYIGKKRFREVRSYLQSLYELLDEKKTPGL